MIRLNKGQAEAVNRKPIDGPHNLCFPRQAKDGFYYMNKAGTHDVNRGLLNGLGNSFPLVDSDLIEWPDDDPASESD